MAARASIGVMRRRPTSILGGLTCTLALTLPGVSLAAPPEDEESAEVESPAEAEPVPEDEDPLDEAKRLFEEGAGKFETADYAGAIEAWTRAYSIVPNLPDYAATKAKLIANLASAQERAYAVDKETSHLNQAKILLESYQEAIPAIYTSTIEKEKEQAWVEDRLEKIDAELQAAAEREAAAEEDQRQSEKTLEPGQGMIVTGAVLTGLGVAGLGVMVTGMVIGNGANDIDDIPTNDLNAREARFDRGRMGNALALAGGLGGAVLVGTGVALLAVGVKKKRAAGEEEKPEVSVVPALAPGFAGVGLSGRF